MDALKKLGGVFASHYEKIILSVILLALLGAAAFLPFRVAQNRQTIADALATIEKRGKKESKPVDTTEIEKAIKNEKSDPKLSLSGEHNLFNPVLWKRGRDGAMIKIVKGDEDGPGGLTVVSIRPLHLQIAYEGVQTSGDSVRYKFGVLDESKGRSARPRQLFLEVGVGNKRDPIVLTKVTPPADNPPSVEFRFSDSTETVTLTPDQPFRRVAGYEADLKHEKLGTPFNNVRAKQPNPLRLSSQSYNIVAITKDEVTVQSSTSNKRWTVRLKGTPER